LKLSFPYPHVSTLNLPSSVSISLLEPKSFPSLPSNQLDVIRKGLIYPIGLPRLADMARGKRNIVILIDDYTRNTPVNLILPELLSELHLANIEPKSIRFLVASGTHRPMTFDEKCKKVGNQIMLDYKIIDHQYDDVSQLVQLPTTSGGIEVWVNRIVIDSDLVIGIGHIVPHRVAGFSGGGKIIQPGVCGAVTTGQTHWLSAQFNGSEIIGVVDNPIRQEIENVAGAAGLKFIVNAVLDGTGKLVECFCGDPQQAFRAGAKCALEVFGAFLGKPTDIVISDSYPADIDLWQASKAIYSADLALRPGGILILVTPCHEGVSMEFPQILDFGYRSYKEVKKLVNQGLITDLTLAAHLAHVGRVICDKSTSILVSEGIGPETAHKIGFDWASNPQEALDKALKRKGKNASIAILKNGGEVMPIVENAGYEQ
jgi:lactate racemase